MITTAKRLGALLSACLLLWSASISAFADEAGMPESEAPPEKTQQEDAALSDRDFYLEDSEVATYAAANQQAGISKVHFYSLKSSVTTTIFGTLGGLPAKAMVTNSVYYPAYCLDKELNGATLITAGPISLLQIRRPFGKSSHRAFPKQTV